MTDWNDILKPAPVYCDGCGGEIYTGELSFVEHLR